MDAAASGAVAGCAARTILAYTHGTEAPLDEPPELLAIVDAVVLHAEPQRSRIILARQLSVSTPHEILRATTREVVVAEVNLLDSLARGYHAHDLFDTVVVNAIAEELQSPQLRTPLANLLHRPKATCGERVAREVKLSVGQAFLLLVLVFEDLPDCVVI